MKSALGAACVTLALLACSGTGESSGDESSGRGQSRAAGRDGIERATRGAHSERDESAAASDRDVSGRVQAALLTAIEGASVMPVDDDTLAIVRGGVTAELELEPVQRQCRAAPDDCEALVQRLVDAVVDAAPVAPALSRSQVRAVLHDAAWLEQSGHDTAITSAFAGDLSIVYVLDFPTTIEALTGAQRFELAIGTDADLHALALENMARDLAEFPIEPLGDEAPGVFALRAGDSYEAARVLLHDRWSELSERVEGELVIGIPSRDLVLFAGAARPAHIAALRRNTAHLSRTLPQPLSAALFRWRAGGWEPYSR